MADNDIHRIPIKDILQEEGAKELAASPDMEPYVQLIMAQVRGADPSAELEVLRQLSLEKRYIWRVASALKWAFADCDTESVKADRAITPPKDFSRVLDLLELRPVQFCMFLSALIGPEEMQRIMAAAIGAAKHI